jgi:predicted ATPase
LYDLCVKALGSKLFVVGAELSEHAPRDYRLDVPAMRDFDGIEFKTPVTFFVGENGSGKSTIIEALAVAAGFDQEGGSKNFRFETVRREDEADQSLFFHLTRSRRYPSDGYFLTR